MGKKEKPAKKKKYHIGLWITLGFFSVFFIGVGVLFGLVFDKTTNTTEYQEKTITEIGTRSFINGLHGLTNNGKINVGISKNDINGLLVNVQKEQLANVTQIKKMYILMNSNTRATLYVEAKASILQSRLSIETEIVNDDVNGKLILRIHDVKLGDLPLSKNVARNIFLIVGLDDGTGVKNVGDFIFDFAKWEISMSKDVIFDAVKNNVGEGLVTDILATIQDKNLVSFDVDTANLIEMVIDLNSLKRNDEFLTNDNDHIIINRSDSTYAINGVDEIHAVIDSRMQKIINHASSLDSSQLQNLFKYLFNGYEASSDEVRNTINTLNANNAGLFRKVGIPDVTKYESYGSQLKSDAGSLLGNAKAQINEGDLISSSGAVCTIYEKDLNKYLRGQGVIGNSGVVSFKVGDKLEYAFFVVDNFYCNLYQTGEGENKVGHMCFVVGVNISGFETYIILDMSERTDSTDGNVYFKLDKLYFGEIDATENLSKTVFDMLEQNLPSGEMIGIHKDAATGEREIYFNLEGVAERVREFPGFTTISASNIKVEVAGNGVKDEGCLNVTI